MGRLCGQWGITVWCVLQWGTTALHDVYALFPNKLAVARSILAWAPLRSYREYTGGATAHGFFAPQVASMFILQLQQRTENGTRRWNGPALLTQSGKTRYVTLLNQCQYLLPSDRPADRAKRKRVERLIRRIAYRELPPSTDHPTRCVVYAVRHVPLGTASNQGGPRLEILYDAFIDANDPPQ